MNDNKSPQYDYVLNGRKMWVTSSGVVDLGPVEAQLQPNVVTSTSPALKFDTDKTSRPELIAPEMIEALGTVLAYGARKYADRNWEKGMAWHRPFGALMRHMWAWWKGEEKDPETSYSHLWHAACCLMFLIAYESRKVGEDTRWKNEQG